MTQVKMLTSPTCGYCQAAKNLFEQRGIEYQEIDLIKNGELAQQMLTQSGQRTVPQIFINEKSIGGYTELTQLLKNSEFDLNHLSTF